MRTRGHLYALIAAAVLLAACDGPKGFPDTQAQVLYLDSGPGSHRIVSGGDLYGPRFTTRGAANILTVTGSDSRGFGAVLILNTSTFEAGIVSRADSIVDPTTGFRFEPWPDDDSKGGSPSQGGDFAVFLSRATNLLEARRTVFERKHIYLRDVLGRTNELISVGASPGPGNETRILVPDDTSLLPEANAHTKSAILSGDGRFVAFASSASNLVPLATNGVSQIFLFDRAVRSIEIVSWGEAQGTIFPGDGDSRSPYITGTGRYVAYRSNSTNLVADDNETDADVFVFDRSNRATERVNGTLRDPGPPVVSEDASTVVFSAVDRDGDGTRQIFALVGPPNARVSRPVTDGANNPSAPAISADGRFVVYVAEESPLAHGRNDSATGIFLFDMQTGFTRRITETVNGEPASGMSLTPTISADGTLIAFVSNALDLAVIDARRIVEEDGELRTTVSPTPAPSQALDLYLTYNPFLQ